MANWKHYINSGFAGCRLLAYARDYCRDRDVRIYQIPGQVDAVGISDGVDAWIAPVRADVFSVNVARLFDDMQAGRELPKPVPPVRRGRVRLEPEDAPLPIRKPRVVIAEPINQRRSRVQLEA